MDEANRTPTAERTPMGHEACGTVSPAQDTRIGFHRPKLRITSYTVAHFQTVCPRTADQSMIPDAMLPGRNTRQNSSAIQSMQTRATGRSEAEIAKSTTLQKHLCFCRTYLCIAMCAGSFTPSVFRDVKLAVLFPLQQSMTIFHSVVRPAFQHCCNGCPLVAKPRICFEQNGILFTRPGLILSRHDNIMLQSFFSLFGWWRTQSFSDKSEGLRVVAGLGYVG